MESTPLLGSISSHHGSIRDENTTYTLSSHRWFMLVVLALLNFSNGMIWISFSPIADITAQYYGVNDGQVDWLSLVYILASVPFGVVAIWMLDNKGLKAVINLGALLNFVGSTIRIISIVHSIPASGRYPVLLVGQSIAAVAQPFALFSTTKLAAVWFPPHQRATANMLCSMANPLGIMAANIISPIIVQQPNHLFWMLELYCVPAALTFFLAYMGVTSSRPEHAPSLSADETPEPFFVGIKQLCGNVRYWVLAMCFGSGVALFTTLSTFFEQVLCARGYTDVYSGIVGALLIAFGLVGAAVASAFVDKTKRFEETAKFCYSMAAVMAIVFAVVSRLSDISVAIAVVISGIGLFGFAFYPIGLELAVESTYPVAEATSSGVLMLSGQVQSILYIVLMQYSSHCMPDDGTATCGKSGRSGDDVKPMDYTVPLVILGTLSATSALVFTTFYKCHYNRVRAEQERIAERLVPAVNLQVEI